MRDDQEEMREQYAERAAEEHRGPLVYDPQEGGLVRATGIVAGWYKDGRPSLGWPAEWQRIMTQGRRTLIRPWGVMILPC